MKPLTDQLGELKSTLGTGLESALQPISDTINEFKSAISTKFEIDLIDTGLKDVLAETPKPNGYIGGGIMDEWVNHPHVRQRAFANSVNSAKVLIS